MTRLFINNRGPEIATTNFWDLTFGKEGYFYLSANAGTFRLLVPGGMRHCLLDIRTADIAIVSTGPWPAQRRDIAIEILFDEHSDNPFAIHLGAESFDRLPPERDSGRMFRLLVYTAGPQLVFELPCGYRRVAIIPSLTPWTPQP